ncbi:MAG: hypothetical protein EAZ36_06935 [Verrucomicrobia bacterium]|nr:MAG: hypothetical protein EAZ36_06935 [Verrucomicrobiota bacterium]
MFDDSKRAARAPRHSISLDVCFQRCAHRTPLLKMPPCRRVNFLAETARPAVFSETQAALGRFA